MGWPRQQVGCKSIFNDAATIHYCHPGGQSGQNANIVADADHRHPGLASQFVQ
jgi:hypothetical protein